MLASSPRPLSSLFGSPFASATLNQAKSFVVHFGRKMEQRGPRFTVLVLGPSTSWFFVVVPPLLLIIVPPLTRAWRAMGLPFYTLAEIPLATGIELLP
jgi:hypothetical protein